MHVKELRIAPPDCGKGGELGLTPLLEHFQDAANEAAWKLGATVSQILPLGFTWMLVKYRLRVGRMPRAGETLALGTWHYPHGRLYSLRAFEARSNGVSILRADTAWVLVDLVRRKPFQIEKGLPDLFEEQNPPIPFEFEKLQPFREGPWTTSLLVADGDMDDNGHVNHVRYLDWAVAAIPAAWRDGRTFTGFDAEFHGEGRAGETLEVFSNTAEGPEGETVCLHGIHRPADGAELFRMRTTWR